MGRTDVMPPEIAGEPRSRIPHWALLTGRLVPWAERSENVRSLAILGSTVRADRPGDEWSDMDLLILATDPDLLSDLTDWLDDIGTWWATLKHDAPVPGVVVRQVVFEGGADFDIIPMRTGILDRLIDENPEGMAAALGTGLRVILDKDGELAATTLPVPSGEPDGWRPSPEGFEWVVNDLLFQCVYAAKHLRRGELWLAKDDVDCYMRNGLMRLIEWHARAGEPASRVWDAPRYLEWWADPRIVQALPPTFADYSPPGVGRALAAFVDLLGWVGPETAARLGTNYPSGRHDAVSAWVRSTLAEGGLVAVP